MANPTSIKATKAKDCLENKKEKTCRRKFILFAYGLAVVCCGGNVTKFESDNGVKTDLTNCALLTLTNISV
jgi:hypothetical protein